MAKTDPLLEPFTLNGLTIRNRIVSTPHAPAYAEDGMPAERYQLYHEEKARGGIGMTMFGGSSCVSADSPSVFGQLDVSGDRVIPYFQQFADRIHAHGAALLCQISHLGRRTTWNDGDWLPVVAPSRVREHSHRGFPKAMDAADIRRIVGDYAAAARRCKEGGLDGVEVLQNGHLLSQFLSPDLNLRNDGYGGSLENRARFALEVFEAVREAVGSDFVVGIRMEIGGEIEGATGYEDSIRYANMLREAGAVDYLNLNVGRPDHNYELSHYGVPSMFQKLAPFLANVATFRREVDLPVIHAIRIPDLPTARHAVQEGIVDLIGMTRAHIADPHLVRKMIAGQEDRIRPCVGAGYCIDRIYGEGEALCLHNVATGREATISHLTPPSSGPARKVVVVGGGPAGMEAARVCAERGHSVVLFEAGAKLGGQVRIAAQAKVRRDIIGIADWLAGEVETLGVDIRLNTYAESEEILAETPDAVIIATGGLPDTGHVEGGDLCLSVWDVLDGAKVEGDVLVYDDNGQHQAPSLVCDLAERDDVRVAFVTTDRAICMEMGASNYPKYLEKFHRGGVRVTPDHRLVRVERDGNALRALFHSDYGGPEVEMRADHIVIEHGTIPLTDTYDELAGKAINGGVTDLAALVAGQPQPIAKYGFTLHRIGDAVASRNIHAAIYDARRLALGL